MEYKWAKFLKDILRKCEAADNKCELHLTNTGEKQIRTYFLIVRNQISSSTKPSFLLKLESRGCWTLNVGPPIFKRRISFLQIMQRPFVFKFLDRLSKKVQRICQRLRAFEWYGSACYPYGSQHAGLSVQGGVMDQPKLPQWSSGGGQPVTVFFISNHCDNYLVR